MRSKKLVFTGGGSAGHVTPNLALIEALDQKLTLAYIGSENGIEATLIKAKNIPYYAIQTGKLRRYFSWQNFIDPFKVLFGFVQAYRLLGTIQPDLVFSKGGFVSVPVIMAAYWRKIPVILHESDMSPGLANRICLPFAKKICVNFKEVARLMKHPEKIHVTGTPIRQFLFEGQRDRGLLACGFDANKKTILIIGGSLGAKRINDVIRKILPNLMHRYQVIHICGQGHMDARWHNTPGYVQLEYAHENLADLFAMSDMIISRAGANVLCEILSLAKPHLLIPLQYGSRGDQVDNARYFEKQGSSVVLSEMDLTEEHLLAKIEEVFALQTQLIQAMQTLDFRTSTDKVKNILLEELGYIPVENKEDEHCVG